MLRHPLDPFQESTAQTRAHFETQTAAINVTPSDNGPYDIKQIKEDSLWLSKETKIDELSALRIAVLEWQTRAAGQLLSGFTEEETLSIQDAAGRASLGSSTLLADASLLTAPVDAVRRTLATFSSTEQRRLRLLKLYLSERTHLLKVYEILTRAALLSDHAAPSLGTKGKAKASSPWLVEAGHAILETKQSDQGGDPPSATILLRCIRTLRTCLNGLQSGSGWYVEEGGNVDIEDYWGQTQIAVIIHTMRLMFVHLVVPDRIPASSIVTAWFRFAGDCAFLKVLQPVNAAPNPAVVQRLTYMS